MLSFSSHDAVREMQDGEGIYIVPNFLSEEVRQGLIDVTDRYQPDRFGTVRRLLDKTPYFDPILLHTDIQETCRLLFGPSFRLGSLDTKILEPRGPDDEPFELRPHVDFPSYDMVGAVEGEANPFYGIPMALKVFIPLSDLTYDSGATAYIPGSQKWHRDPEKNVGEFEARMERGEANRLMVPGGSLAMWSGPLWHADLDNLSDSRRYLTHICMVSGLSARPQVFSEMYPQEYFDRAQPKIAELLGAYDSIPAVDPNVLNAA
jgi:hypothetical protein